MIAGRGGHGSEVSAHDSIAVTEDEEEEDLHPTVLMTARKIPVMMKPRLIPMLGNDTIDTPDAWS